jgi:hypothetical protein
LAPFERRLPQLVASLAATLSIALCDREQRSAGLFATLGMARSGAIGDLIHMLFVVGAIIVLIALVVAPRMQVGHGTNADTLGWMSQRWLNEYRASRLG